MSEAFDYSARTDAVPRARAARRSAAPALPPIEAMLTDGGDARIALDPATLRNQYGCSVRPDQTLAEFASSTASTLSERGFAAAEALRARIADALASEPPALVYARELEALRRSLMRLCGLDTLPGLDVVFAASGTDIHLLASALVGGSPEHPLLCLSVEPAETGSGVPAALGARHFSSRTALGEHVERGEALTVGHATFVSVAARDAGGALRPGADVEAELDALCHAASRVGRRTLLTLTDVTKTGLISPGVETALALARRFPTSLTVLVDACQFRLAPATLRAYLEHGVLVALTGSKFLTGPTFSGALLVPEALAAAGLASRLLPAGLRAYSARAEWPTGWVAGAGMSEATNFGLALRWKAALAELAAFRALPEAEVAGFMTAFAGAVTRRIAEDPALEALPARPLDRTALGGATGWDAIPSIFSFRLKDRAGVLDPARTEAVYRALAASGVRFGQPVRCGEAGSALRLCNSARLVIEALSPGGDPAAVIARALSALGRVSKAADQAAAEA